MQRNVTSISLDLQSKWLKNCGVSNKKKLRSNKIYNLLVLKKKYLIKFTRSTETLIQTGELKCAVTKDYQNFNELKHKSWANKKLKL